MTFRDFEGPLLIVVFILVILAVAFFGTVSLISGAIRDSCKDIYFPNKAQVDYCIDKGKCQEWCDYDFKNFLCPNYCKKLYGVD